MPVVGMVGGGQLGPDDGRGGGRPWRHVPGARRVGDGERGACHARRGDRVAPVACPISQPLPPSVTLSRSIMSTCQARSSTSLESDGRPGPAGIGRPQVHPGQAGDAGPAERARRAVPAVRAGRLRVADVAAFCRAPGGSWPVVLKAVSGGYDGKGVWVCESPAEAEDVAWRTAIALLAEEFVPFRRELAALVAAVAVRPGRGVPGRGDRAGGRHLPGGDRARARPQQDLVGRGRRPWRCGSRSSSA